MNTGETKAVKLLREGARIELDGDEGYVSRISLEYHASHGEERTIIAIEWDNGKQSQLTLQEYLIWTLPAKEKAL